MRNEKTGKSVASIAAKVLRQVPKKGAIIINFTHPDYGPAVVQSSVDWADIRTLAASALTQAPDKKPDQMQRALDGKLGTHDDRGFDPRDGGKVGKQTGPLFTTQDGPDDRNERTPKRASSPYHPAAKPKRGRRGVARKGQGKGRSSFYPAAKPKRSSP